MAVTLKVYIVDPDGTIKVGHEFYGRTQAEAEEYFDHHLESCEYFKSAYDEGRVIEESPDDESPLPKPADFDGDEEDETDIEK